MVLSIQHPLSRDSQSMPERSNQLLNLLPKSDLQNLLIDAKRLVLPAQTNLYEVDLPSERVYFPLQGIVSIVNLDEDGSIAEAAAVSSEGIVGFAGFLGGNTSSSLAIVRSKCTVISVSVNILQQEFTRGGELQRILLLYTQALLSQMAQNVFCSCHHTLEQRLARWLSFYSDRLKTQTLLLTQETLADLLGVRRSSLSAIAIDLRHKNLIDYNRGKIQILNPQALKQIACNCDRLISDEYRRLLNL